jgi:hypothetical protein
LDATTATKVPTVIVLITHFINATSFTSVIFAPADELVSQIWLSRKTWEEFLDQKLTGPCHVTA